MAKSLFSAIAALALAAFAPSAAQAAPVIFGNGVTYNFDFSDTFISSQTLNQNTVGNSITFNSTTNPLLKVKATAWSINTKGTGGTGDDVVNAATLKLWSGGLGVKSGSETDTSPNHSIDNSGLMDFVLLQFDYDVDINSITTGWVNSPNGDSDASLRVGAGPTKNPATWNTTPALDGKNVWGSTSNVELNDYVTMANPNVSMNPEGGSSAGKRNVNTGNEHGMIWLIGAALYGSNNNDYFKLDALNLTVFPTIPEPSTWMTMILGFGFVGHSMRRRKASGKAALSLA